MFVCRTVCEKFYESFNYKEAKTWTKKYTQGLLEVGFALSGLRTVSVFLLPKIKRSKCIWNTARRNEDIRCHTKTGLWDSRETGNTYIFCLKTALYGGGMLPGPQSQHVPLLGPQTSAWTCWLLHINKHLWKKFPNTAHSSPNINIIHWKCHTNWDMHLKGK